MLKIARFKPGLVLMLLLCISGCQSQVNKSIAPDEHQLQRKPKQLSALFSHPQIVPLEIFEYRFYAPDQKHYISEKMEFTKAEGEPSPVDTRLYYENNFLDSASYEFGYEQKQQRTPALWMDNQNVVINGNYIFNIEKMTKATISFPHDFTDAHHILNYRLDPAGKIMAYYVAELQGDFRANLTLWFYDLNKHSWKKVFAKQITWMPDWNYYYGSNQLFWDNKDNLYFDYVVAQKYWQNEKTGELIEYNPGCKPAKDSADDKYYIRYIDDHVQIVQYNLTTGKVIDRDQGYSLFDVSPDRKYFIIEKQVPSPTIPVTKYYAMQADTNEIVAEIKSNRYAWSSDKPGELAIARYLDTNNKHSKIIYIEVISLIDGKVVKTIKDDRLMLPSWEFSHVLIDYYDNNYVLKVDEKCFMIKSLNIS